jgi:hypothetical protein
VSDITLSLVIIIGMIVGVAIPIYVCKFTDIIFNKVIDLMSALFKKSTHKPIDWQNMHEENIFQITKGILKEFLTKPEKLAGEIGQGFGEIITIILHSIFILLQFCLAILVFLILLPVKFLKKKSIL